MDRVQKSTPRLFTTSRPSTSSAAHRWAGPRHAEPPRTARIGTARGVARVGYGQTSDGKAAYAVLVGHRNDPQTGHCPVCLLPGPCRPANAAANRLAELGLPIIEPGAVERTDRWTAGLRSAVSRLVSRPKPAPRPPLLTFGWRWRLGLVQLGQGH